MIAAEKETTLYPFTIHAFRSFKSEPRRMGDVSLALVATNSLRDRAGIDSPGSHTIANQNRTNLRR
jgi:hypothetical protein